MTGSRCGERVLVTGAALADGTSDTLSGSARRSTRTPCGGELLGDPNAGRLVVGRPAHFSPVHGDPLSDPAALWRVWLTR
jgi:hypothetical protein